ncbi:uncharacterized protein LOC133181712 [Saccostrea echinata]|uniref:uncharacterized protein LOC133181712 n=1 Tax=Saccostrea echinata TaxID=191078 RepID=UPI002A8133D9|nr:uncharacterized protein LOC133181712 [Saccostrea echinata]
MTDGDFNPGWFLCDMCAESCTWVDGITSQCSAACERLRFCVANRNVEGTDIEHVSTQEGTLELLSNQSTRIDEHNISADVEALPNISVSPPSYEIVCDSDCNRTDSETILTPALSLEIHSTQSLVNSEEHHITNDVENHSVNYEPPPSYDIAVFDLFQPPPSYDEVIK